MKNKIAFFLLVIACSVGMGYYVVEVKRTSKPHIIVKANLIGDTIWEVRVPYKKEYIQFRPKEFIDAHGAIAYKERIDSIVAKNKELEMHEVGFYK